jgi:hypothetical protein
LPEDKKKRGNTATTSESEEFREGEDSVGEKNSRLRKLSDRKEEVFE